LLYFGVAVSAPGAAVDRFVPEQFAALALFGFKLVILGFKLVYELADIGFVFGAVKNIHLKNLIIVFYGRWAAFLQLA
jgi:hypothetical protein